MLSTEKPYPSNFLICSTLDQINDLHIVRRYMQLAVYIRLQKFLGFRRTTPDTSLNNHTAGFKSQLLLPHRRACGSALLWAIYSLPDCLNTFSG